MEAGDATRLPIGRGGLIPLADLTNPSRERLRDCRRQSHRSQPRGPSRVRLERRSPRTFATAGSVVPVSVEPPPPGSPPSATRLQDRTSNHLLAQFHLHSDGGAVRQLASGYSKPANQELPRYFR